MSGAPANGARWLFGAALAAQLSLSACGGGSSNSTSSTGGTGPAANGYSLNAAISGLNASGLVLSVNGNSVSVGSGTTTQMLANSLASGTPYAVTVATQPAGETCSVSASSGTIASANGSVVVTCSARAFSLGGTITGLSTTGLVLANGGNTLTISSGAKSFNFPTPVAYGSPYDVTVQTQPVGLTCTPSGNVGTIPAANVTSVALACAPNTYTVGGSITGLNAPGLVLQDNGTDATSFGADATTFTMHTPVTYGGSYEVAVQVQPTGRLCTVSDGSGTVGAGNVTNISIACVPNMAILYSFAGAPGSGANSYAGLIQGSNGLLYGTTEEGGSSNVGVIFNYNPGTGAAGLLHSFVGGNSDGANPYAGLIADGAGNLYGTTPTGGSYLCAIPQLCASNFGTVFKINPTTGAETLLYSFRGSGYSDGEYPYGGLLLGSDGYFFGTTQKGGTGGYGTVYRLSPSLGTETVLHAFAGGSADGAYPYAGLIQASDGNLYGTTQQGGASGSGTVFKINPTTGAASIAYSFAGGSDGAGPYDGLIQATDGNLYGTTGAGGAAGAGTVFKIVPSTGAESIVYAFAGGSSDGANPYAGLIQATDGSLYGTTVSGGSGGAGTVFKITPGTGAESIVYAFSGGSSDGANPYGGLIQATDGKLYGTTLKGGANDAGIVFSISLP
ncbi:MAG TPA: choice-of-anchor tandem repeat GloVer-containing protein [Steroidobacteraceae bacterium]|jgi:uncharacterized repeat protein (TIGR03803 family)|nr:choice-of-anchor tandem repeat GloVer-containing protein [Steroidobacteraceae bacterium]